MAAAAGMGIAMEAMLVAQARSGSHCPEAVGQNWTRAGYCYSCHNDAFSLRVARVAREHGLPVDEALALKEARKAYSWMANPEEAALGVYFVDPALVDAIELVSARDAGFPATLALEAYARRIVRLQLPNGGWISSDRRPPQSHSAWSATAYSLEAVRDYLPPELAAQKQQVFAKGRGWLLTQKPESTEDRNMQLWGLAAAGAGRAEIAKTAAALLTAQREDGGWAQTETRESDAYATGQTLSALYETGVLRTADPPFQRGLRYLIRTQQPDGTWRVKTRLHAPLQISPPYMETGFPHAKDQFISASGNELERVSAGVGLTEAAGYGCCIQRSNGADNMFELMGARSTAGSARLERY